MMPWIDSAMYFKMLANVGIVYALLGSNKKAAEEVAPPPHHSTSPIIQCSNTTGCNIKLLYANNQTATVPTSYWDKQFFASQLTVPNALRLASCGGLAIGTYIVVEYMRSLACIRSESMWGAFEEETDLVELATANSQGAVLKRLITTIIMTYAQIASIDEKIHMFLLDLQKESERYRRFINYREKVESLKMARIMPGTESDVAKAQGRLKRCQFLKKIISSYLAEKYAVHL